MPEVKEDQELINPQPEGQAPITGYRKMKQEDVDAINRIKALGATIKDVLGGIEAEHLDIDKRWLQLAHDNIQTGLMQANRAIAKPDTYA